MTTSTMGLDEANQRMARRVILLVSRALSYLVYAYVIVVEIILFLGFFLLLFGANPSAGFADWVYRSLDRTMEPFRGIFTPIELGTTSGNDIESVFETSVLFAMIVYGIVSIAIHALITWMTDRIHRLDAEEQRLIQELEREQAAAWAQASAAEAEADTIRSCGSAGDDTPPAQATPPLT